MNVKVVYDHHSFGNPGPTVRDAGRGFIISLRASGSHRPRSLDSLEETLGLFSLYAEEKGWPDCLDITTGHIEEYLSYLQVRPKWNSPNSQQGLSMAYVEIQYRRLKQFFAWLVTRGHRDTSPLDVIPRPRVDEKVIPTVSDHELHAILATVDPRKAISPTDKFWRLRDRALLLLLWDTPSRKSELAELRLGDVDIDEAGITVMGKGGRQRWMPIGYTVVEAIWEYLQARAQRAPLTDRLWVQSEGKPMRSPNWTHLMLKRRCKEAGIPPLHLHQFRHTYIMAAIRNKTPDQTIRAATGHRKQIPATYYRTLGADELATVHREFSPADRLGQQSDNGWNRKKRGNTRGRL